MIRVLLVDDHPALREGLKRIFEHTCDIRVVAEAGEGREALRIWRRTPVDVVLLDLELPDMAGRQVLRALRGEQPEVKVVVFSIHADEIFAERLLAAGARAYMQKDCPPDHVVEAVRRVHLEGVYLSPGQAHRAVARLKPGRPAYSFDRLSEREIEVMTRLCQGQGTNQMAHALAVSAQTVSTYKARIAAKLGLAETSQLALACEALRDHLLGR